MILGASGRLLPPPPTPFRGLGGELEERAGESLTKNSPGPPLKLFFPYPFSTSARHKM